MRDGTPQLGNYRLIRLLGRGGFGDVYLGEHIHLKTQAAIKVLQAQLSENDRESFTREAQIIASLVHPHIVRVLEFGIENAVPFLVMDYASGGPLRQAQTMPLPTVVSYVKQVASALQYAHNRKIIHRDVKPENMLLRQPGELLLSDFGIALVTQSTRYQLSSASAAGTVGYMAPEQLQGRASAASDQYALGIVVYEWLCGERPFKGSYIDVGNQHLFATPPSLCAKMPTLSPEVEGVVLTTLAKDPQSRFTNVQSFAQALEQASNATGSGKTASIYAPGAALGTQKNAGPPPPPLEPTILPSYLQSDSLPIDTGQHARPVAAPIDTGQHGWSSSTPINTSGYPPTMPALSLANTPRYSNYVPPTPPPYPMGSIPSAAYTSQQQGKPRRKTNGCCIASAVLLVVLILVGIGGSSLATLLSLTGFKSASNTPDTHDVNAKAGTVLYNEQGGDNWSGWSLGGEWKTLHNVLLSDGTAPNSYGSSSDTIWSPHVVGVANYALDATIQITSSQQNCYFGLVGRGGTSTTSSSNNNGSSGYVGGIAVSGYPQAPNETISYYTLSSSSSYINQQQYDPGAKAHTYHVQFVDTRIAMKIDNGSLIGVTDNISLNGGQVGIESGGCQLAISKFTITKL